MSTTPAVNGQVLNINLGGINGPGAMASAALAEITGLSPSDFPVGTQTTEVTSEVVIEPTSGAPDASAATATQPPAASISAAIATAAGIPTNEIAATVVAITPPAPKGVRRPLGKEGTSGSPVGGKSARVRTNRAQAEEGRKKT